MERASKTGACGTFEGFRGAPGGLVALDILVGLDILGVLAALDILVALDILGALDGPLL